MDRNVVTVVFTRNHRIGSVALRWWMRSRFSHCALVDTTAGTVIEAVSADGVRERNLSELIRESSHYEFIQIPCTNPDQILAHAREQLGKSYDWRAVLGFWFRRSWQRTDAFICSELVAWAFDAGGEPVVRRESYRVSPEALYLPIWVR